MVKELLVISKSKRLAVTIYSYTNEYLPKEEMYGLISQIRRCAVSVPSNLAEGQQRSDKDFKRFIQISRGSLSELKVQLEISSEIYNHKDNPVIKYLLKDIDELQRMTYSLMLKLKSDNSKT